MFESKKKLKAHIEWLERKNRELSCDKFNICNDLSSAQLEIAKLRKKSTKKFCVALHNDPVEEFFRGHWPREKDVIEKLAYELARSEFINKREQGDVTFYEIEIVIPEEKQNDK